MSISSPNTAGLSDGPNKKSRLLELIQLPESLDDALVHGASSSSQQQQRLPADEAQDQLGTLQLGSVDEPMLPTSVVDPGVHEAPTATDIPISSAVNGEMSFGMELSNEPRIAAIPASAAASDILMATETPVSDTVAGAPADASIVAPPLTSEQVQTSIAARLEECVGVIASHREQHSLESAPSDAMICVSFDGLAGSSAPEGLVGDEGEGEVASRTVGSGALLGGNGASGGRTGGFEVFIGGLAADAREEDVRAALAELAQGEVLSIRLQMTRGSSICKGYGFATFSDELAAQRLLAGAAVPPQTMNRGALSIGVLQCGRRVGLHASRRPFRAVLSVAQEAAQLQPLHLSPEPGASINGLLLALREHPDQRAAVAAALQIVQRGAKRMHPSSVSISASPGVIEEGGKVGAGATAQQAQADTAKRQATAGAVAATTDGAVVAVKADADSSAAGATGTDGSIALVNAQDTAPEAIAVVGAGAVPSATSELATTSELTKSAPAGRKEGPAAAGAPTAKGAAGGKKSPREKVTGTGGAAAAGGSAAAAAPAAGGSMSQDLKTALAAYPKVSKLLNSLKGTTRVPKTALMILHEYSTKMLYEASFLETSDGPAGPYAVESRLVSSGPKGTTLATASGKARTKKDAKQVSAAALLEKLLDGPRGVLPQDLLPAPKPPMGASAAAGLPMPAPTRGSGGRASQANGRKGSGGSSRSGSGPPGSGGQGPQPLHFSHQHHRDALNRAGASSGNFKLPPPPPLPPPSYRSSSGPPYGSSAPGSGGRGSFSGGNSGASGGFVQPGLMPASSSMGMGMQGRHGSSGGSGGMAASPFGGSGGSRDAPRPRLGQDTYGASGYSNLGYGGSSAGTGVGGGGGGGAGGGSMVQLGLSSGLGDRSTSTPKGAYDGSMYGRESGRGGGVLAMDTYGGSSSYDMAAGHKRNYSTAMQVAYGSPAASQGLLPVQPPQQPASGALLGGSGGSMSQDPFAVQAGGGSGRGVLGSGGMQYTSPLSQSQPGVIGQMQAHSSLYSQQRQQSAGNPTFVGASQAQTRTFTPMLFSQTQAQSQTAMAAPVQQVFGSYGQSQAQQSQQLQSGFTQQAPVSTVAAASNSLYGGSQAVQLQPAQPQSLFVQSYGQQHQVQQQGGSSGMYSGYAQGGVSAQQQQPQAVQSQSYSLPNSTGLQSFSQAPRTGSGLWG